MFYETEKNDHGLKFNPWKGCVVPRPIGWISSISKEGAINLAPFSCFNQVGNAPPQVMYAISDQHIDGGLKDSLANVMETGEFVCNIVSYDLAKQMNITGAFVGREVNEFELAGLEMLPSKMVKPPRVKGSPVHLECRLVKVVEILNHDPKAHPAVVIGHVVGIHIDDAVITEGQVDIRKMRPVSRLGYRGQYAVTDDYFDLPAWEPKYESKIG
jgi:flavin reductase (DIM6/NTAB) family NADH-FMN oxidoreductase RutF